MRWRREGFPPSAIIRTLNLSTRVRSYSRSYSAGRLRRRMGVSFGAGEGRVHIRAMAVVRSFGRKRYEHLFGGDRKRL